MRTIKYVLVSTAAGHWGNLATIKADGHVANSFWLRLYCRFCHCATQVETYMKEREERVQLLHSDATKYFNSLKCVVLDSSKKNIWQLLFSSKDIQVTQTSLPQHLTSLKKKKKLFNRHAQVFYPAIWNTYCSTPPSHLYICIYIYHIKTIPRSQLQQAIITLF